MPEPLVSMIMPVWRPREEWLLEAVRSALAQQRCDLELIVVDDGNREPVAALLADIDDERLRVLRVEHGGECAARNAGTAEARGEVLRHLDADDVYPTDSTARLLALLGDRDDIIAYGATLHCDEELRPRWRMSARTQGEARSACLLGLFPSRMQAMLLPRTVVDKVGLWDEQFRVSQDWDFVLRALDHATVAGTTAVCHLYRRHDEAATTDIEAGEAGARRVLKRYFERHPQHRGTRLERRAEVSLDAIFARVLLTHGQARLGAHRAMRALICDPRSIVDELRRSWPAARAAIMNIR
jgi:glycosyltransferase involved in cell wall biosynthesis